MFSNIGFSFNDTDYINQIRNFTNSTLTYNEILALQGAKLYKKYCILNSLLYDTNYKEQKNACVELLSNTFNGQFLNSIFNQTKLLENILNITDNLTPTVPIILINPEHVICKKINYYMDVDNNCDNISNDTGTYFKIVQGIPIVENPKLLLLANVLNVNKNKLWFSSADNVDVIQSTIWGLLYVNNIVINVPFVYTKNPTSIDEISSNLLLALEQKSPSVNELVNLFLSQFYYNNTFASNQLVQLIKTLKNKTPSQLKVINDTLISALYQASNKDYTEAVNLNKETQKPTLEQLQIVSYKCDNFDYKVIYNVFLNYPKFVLTQNLSSVDVCPIQLKSIISAFPYYKYNLFTVNGLTINSTNNVTLILNLEKEAKFIKIMEKLNNSVKFDGNYQAFHDTLCVNPLSEKKIQKLLHFYYTLPNLEFATIAATIHEHTFGTQLNSNIMYNITCSLTSSSLTKINQTLGFVPNYKKMSILHILFENLGSLYIPNMDNINSAITELSQLNQLIDLVLASRQYTFNIFEIAVYYQLQETITRKLETILLLLVLQSNTSFIVKNAVCSNIDMSFDLETLTSTKYVSKLPVVKNANINKDPLNGFYFNISNNFDFCTNYESLIDYLRQSHDLRVSNILTNYICKHGCD